MKKTILFLAALAISACQTQTIKVQSQNTELNSSNVATKENKTPVTEEFLISANGIGKARLGMTIGELKEISAPDTEFELISPFSNDTKAIAVSQKGIVQYYIIFSTNTTSVSDRVFPSDSDRITLLMTNNHHYQTTEGVKVGTPIKEAEDIYGDAILAYKTEGEPKEYITFGSENPENIKFKASYFKLISDGLGFSGIYSEYPGVSYTTDKYRDDAAVAAIEVTCEPNNCLNYISTVGEK